ncbi:MAG: hypothetical protein NC205_07655 [Prevotella sp.]|nr:hypothetical protein [Alistipes senegalensis]MCM1358455.1 hypothetical protein [Prevotella sp.]MCM1474216.1 hypothetical protein [Muribaculaceae bacterium]
MACFLVPAAEAVITTITKKVISKKETENQEINFSEKLGWLNKMLWGGSALLAFEHLWHGEITPFFPFLTNAADSADRVVMFQEMATSGVGMSVLVTAVWFGMISVISSWEKKKILEKAVQK